jgi:hypothetical protein
MNLIEVINISLDFFPQGLQNGQLKLQIGVYLVEVGLKAQNAI